tara:strand:+ start:2663 stop:4762 length:2100 start_codon:yes stop_codon:yes gene_type:complete
MNLYKQYAREFTDAGYSVIPDKFMSKQPAIKGWTNYCNNKPTEQEIENWCNSFDTSNVAVCLGEASGIVAIDLDCIDPEIVSIIERIVPPTKIEKIGNKGWTRFFKYTKGIETDNVKHNGNIILEVLSTGKKTTIPPSVHPSGNSYTWKGESLASVKPEDLDAFPIYLIPMLKQKIKEHYPDAEEVSYNKIVQGRNDALSKECAKLVKEENDPILIISKLINFDKDNHDNPLFTDVDEFGNDHAATNAGLFFFNHLRSYNNKRFNANQTYEDIILPTEGSEGKSKSEASENSNTPELPKPEGVLAAIMNYILQNSYIEQPAFCFSAALSLLATLSGRKFEFEGVAPNLYLLNVAPSGSGKNAPQEKIKEVLIDAKCDYLLGSGDYVSDASLMDGLPESPVRLDIIDEAGGMLKSVTRGGATYNAKMADILAELYTTSTSIFLGRQTSEGNKGRALRPNVNLLCSTTPTGLSEGVTVSAIEKGLMGRFLIFIGDGNKKARRVEQPTRLDHSVLGQLQSLAAYQPDKSDKVIAGHVQDVTILEKTDSANQMLQQAFEYFDNLRIKSDGEDVLLPIISRLYQQMLKVTMLHAISRQIYSQNPIVDHNDVTFGYQTIQYFYHHMQDIINKCVFSNKNEQHLQKVLSVLEKSEEGLTKKQLSNRTRFLKKKERNELLEDLLEAGQIEYVTLKKEGKVSYVYRRV